MSAIKVVRVIGGLGNQMFQICFYQWLKKQFPQFHVSIDLQSYAHYTLHDGYLMDQIFQTNADVADANTLRKVGEFQQGILYRIKRKLVINNSKIWEETEEIRFQFHDAHIFNDAHQYLDGYWQSAQYPQSLGNTKDLFRFPDFTDEKNLEMQALMQSSNAVSIHVRRGDYVNHPKYKDICNAEYYARALDYLNAQFSDLRFFVFSNDIPWCKENLPIRDAVYVNHNSGKDSFKDMQLMSLCKHHIIANSSFSWWGAYLSQEKGVTIAPKKWKNNMEGTRDLIPNDWIQV
jgi:Glycosyl transferase family 11